MRSYWLWQKRGAVVSQPTISRPWYRKELRQISLNRSKPLRRLYLDDIAAKDLDETMMNVLNGELEVMHQLARRLDIQLMLDEKDSLWEGAFWP
jgi:hypothetical protein